LILPKSSINVRYVKNILVIDDDMNIRTALARELRFLNYHVIPAETGLVAINKIAKQEMDLIIVDMRMPVMGGVEFVKYAFENFPDIPIIVLSGTVTREVLAQLQPYQSSVIDVLAKPWDSDHLHEVIRVATMDLDEELNETSID